MEKEQKIDFSGGVHIPVLITDHQGELIKIDDIGQLWVEKEFKGTSPRLVQFAKTVHNNAPTTELPDNILVQDVQSTFAKCLEVMKRKNRDYGGTNHDPYANFRNANVVGVSVEQGILVRLMDKMSRIATLLEKDPLVVSESVDDTIDDAINYFAILKSYRKNKQP